MAARRRPGGPDTSSTKPTAGDVRHLRAQASGPDRAYGRGYNDGKAGRPAEAPFDEDPAVGASYDQGHAAGRADRQTAAKPRQSGGSSTSSRSGSPGSRSSGGSGFSFDLSGQGAGVILGVVTYALVLNYLAYGWPGVTGWLSAKFLNKVTVGQGNQANQASTGPSQVVLA